MTTSLKSDTAPDYSVETITDLRSFATLESEWNEVLERANVSHPFLRHEWMRVWWECFGANRQLNVLLVRAGARIVAIAPLVLDTAQMYGMTVRRLGFLHNDHTPRADFIIAERHDACYRALWRFLRDQQTEWDVLQLSQVPTES